MAEEEKGQAEAAVRRHSQIGVDINPENDHELNSLYREGKLLHELPELMPTIKYDGDHLHTVSGEGTYMSLSATGANNVVKKFGLAVEDIPIPVSSFDVSGALLAVGSETGDIGMWNVDDRKCLHFYNEHNDKVNAVQLVDRRYIYSASNDGHFKVKDAEKDITVHSFSSCACPLSCFLIERPDVVLIGSWDGYVRMLDLRAKNLEMNLQVEPNAESPVRCMALSATPPPEPKKKPTASKKKGDKKKKAAPKKGKSKKGDKPKAPPKPPPPTFMTSDNYLFVGHGIGDVRAFDLRTRTVFVDAYQGHTDVVNTLTVRDKRLFCGSDDRSTKVFDVERGTLLDTLHGHASGVCGVQVAGEALVTGGMDRTLRTYDLPTIDAAIHNKLLKMEEEKKAAIEAFLAEKAGKKKKGKKGKSKKKKGGKSKKKGGKKSKKKKK